MICGSVNAIYTVLFYHRPTNTYVRTGEDCAQKLDDALNDGTFNAFRAGVRDAREAQAGKRKAMAILEDAGLGVCWNVYNLNGALSRMGWEERTIEDIVGKLIKYGSISDKQMGFLVKLVGQMSQRAVVVRKVDEVVKPYPTGRVMVKGKIVTVRTDNTDFGMVTKMLVESEEGFKVWCTMPSGLSNSQKGDTVEFKATLTPSKDDPKFGYGTRPVAVVSKMCSTCCANTECEDCGSTGHEAGSNTCPGTNEQDRLGDPNQI